MIRPNNYEETFTQQTLADRKSDSSTDGSVSSSYADSLGDSHLSDLGENLYILFLWRLNCHFLQIFAVKKSDKKASDSI